MIIAGIDEVGRGALAGPVVAAAVIITTHIDGIMDSKKLSEKKREVLSSSIINHAICYSIGRAEHDEVDALNIHHATLLAMQRAIDGLSIKPDICKIDGIYAPSSLQIPYETIIGGDAKIYEISAASIIAKVYRDREMATLDSLYPGYDFAKHKGYGTVAHRQAIKNKGFSLIHRKSFSVNLETQDRE